MAKNTREDNLAWPVTCKEILKSCYKLCGKADESVCRVGGSGKDWLARDRCTSLSAVMMGRKKNGEPRPNSKEWELVRLVTGQRLE